MTDGIYYKITVQPRSPMCARAVHAYADEIERQTALWAEVSNAGDGEAGFVFDGSDCPEVLCVQFAWQDLRQPEQQHSKVRLDWPTFEEDEDDPTTQGTSRGITTQPGIVRHLENQMRALARSPEAAQALLELTDSGGNSREPRKKARSRCAGRQADLENQDRRERR